MASKHPALEKAATGGHLLPSAHAAIVEWLNGSFLPEWARDSLEWLIDQEEWEELNNRFYQNIAFGTGGMRNRTVGSVVTPAERGDTAEGEEPAHTAVGCGCLNDFSVIRATVGLYRYTERFLKTTGRGHEVPHLVIAHDVRFFSKFFSELAASTWTRLGGMASVFDGPRSTPQLSYTVRYLKATAGIVITASHNPPHDNGYKVYFEDGGQVVSPHAEGIVSAVNEVKWEETKAFLEGPREGFRVLPMEVDAAYLQEAEGSLLNPQTLKGSPLKVVFTPIHGTGGISTVPLLRKWGVNLLTVPEQMKLDGAFPTVESPNPENAPALAMGIALGEKEHADLVIATDPDADRMGLAVRDPQGQFVLLNGNQIGSLLAEYRIRRFKELGVLPEKGSERAALIKTFVTTPMQEAIAARHGLKCINTLTGFKWIGDKLNDYEKELSRDYQKETGVVLNYDATPVTRRRELLLKYSTFYVFGGEESYGYLASDATRDKDANAAVLMIVELATELARRGSSLLQFLDELYEIYGYYAEQLGNVYHEGASGAAKIKRILETYRSQPPTEFIGQKVKRFTDFGRETLEDADGKVIPPQDFYFVELENGYRYAVRGSGTEPKIKFYCFGEEKLTAGESLSALKQRCRETLTALREAVEKDAEERTKA
jgi:phosphoglucomutase